MQSISTRLVRVLLSYCVGESRQSTHMTSIPPHLVRQTVCDNMIYGPQSDGFGVQLTFNTRSFVLQNFWTLAVLSVLFIVTWKRKVQIQNGQARITLPKRWVEDQDIDDRDEIKLEMMKREASLKIFKA